MRLIDLADETGAIGINLLDARIFTGRDRTADAVVRVARGLWEQWGPRMQSILEHVVKSLHEANMHPGTDPADQYTILDGLPLLSDAKFRIKVLAKVTDPYLLEWWARDFGGWRSSNTGPRPLAPVQTRLAYYASSKRARAILGQSPLDHRCAPHHPRWRHPARLDRAGHGGPRRRSPRSARPSSTSWTP